MLAVAVQGAFVTRVRIAETFARLARIDSAQISLEDLVRLQISEESAVRAFVLTRDPFYRQAYPTYIAAFDRTASRVEATLRDERLAHAQSALREYLRAQDSWRSQVATPMLSGHQRTAAEVDSFTRLFAGYEHDRTQTIRRDLNQVKRALSRSTIDQVNRTLYIRAFYLLVFGLLAILFNAFRSRLDRELAEERTTTEVLQRAIRSEHITLPGTQVGSAYSSATRDLAVGGDIFDMYRLSEQLAMIMVADVSGKGIDAAVLSAFIKFTIRSSALHHRDPGAILTDVNLAFARTVDNPELFVSMFVGILDMQALQLRYASGGHDAAFLRHAKNVRQFPVTGPVLGVMFEPFETKLVHLQHGDTLVLTTDGLTESRNRRGDFLGSDGARELIAACSEPPQQLADELVAKVRARGGNHMSDDLAVLVIRML